MVEEERNGITFNRSLQTDMSRALLCLCPLWSILKTTSHQFRAELLFESLLVPGEDGGVFETSNSLRDQHVETVFHGEHQ